MTPGQQQSLYIVKQQFPKKRDKSSIKGEEDKSPSELDVLQVVLKEMMRHFSPRISFLLSPEGQIFAPMLMFLVANGKAFTRCNQQLAKSIHEEL